MEYLFMDAFSEYPIFKNLEFINSDVTKEEVLQEMERYVQFGYDTKGLIKLRAEMMKMGIKGGVDS